MPDKDSQLTVAVQAGGKSSRMGRDKSFVLFQGQPMIEAVIKKVENLGSQTIIISNNPAHYAYLNLPIYTDVYPEVGPLGGIFTGLTAAKNDHLLVVACDMPWLNRRLLQFLVSLKDKADVIVPQWDKFPEPLHAVYSKQCMEPIKQRILSNDYKITGFFADVKVHYVEKAGISRFDPLGKSFTNVNSPQDLK